jgi:hypothetical protein
MGTAPGCRKRDRVRISASRSVGDDAAALARLLEQE